YHCSSDDASDSCYAYPSPEEERPPPPYPSSSSCYPPLHHFYPRAPQCARPVAPGPESVSPGPSPPPPPRWSCYPHPSPPPPPPSAFPPHLPPINSNPKPCSLHLPKQSSLHLPKQSSLAEAPHAPPLLETNVSPLYIKTPLVLTRHDSSLGPHPPNLPLSASPPWAACACSRERGAKLTR
ncbi:uncharacterized protein, partial [Salvelinus sp. IW2-2015]|uniref:uncharacterized protein n=1 Tax=Salvelinus sp. IW2-2015 TaxID=2691554 RepID=UPI0038D3CBB0